MLAYCRERDFHFVNGVDWVDFNDGRRSLQITAYDFQPEDLTVRFVLEAGINAEALSLILPYAFRGAPMQSARVNGEPVPILARDLEGRPQVLLTADYTAGKQHVWEIQWDSGNR